MLTLQKDASNHNYSRLFCQLYNTHNRHWHSMGDDHAVGALGIKKRGHFYWLSTGAKLDAIIGGGGEYSYTVLVLPDGFLLLAIALTKEIRRAEPNI